MLLTRIPRHPLYVALCAFFGLMNAALALTATAVFPANRATNVCVDTPLRITFDAAPTLGASGSVKIRQSDGAVVETIDLALNAPNGTQPRSIGDTTYNAHPVLVSENTAIIFPRPDVLKHNTTYHITVDAGFFSGFPGVGGEMKWSFTTKPAPPSPDAATLTVDADGSGDFTTIQGAVDFLPADNTIRRQINIRDGTYREIVRVNSKHNLTFRGQSRKGTIISYPNNNNLNPATNTRVMFNVAANDISFQNLRLSNSTPKGGSQAEALRINGQRCVVRDCDLHSYQDTLLVNSATDSAYLVNSLIEGDVDFIWGSGRMVFQHSEIKSLGSGYICQTRNPAGQCGAVFLDCKLTRAEGVTKVYLARIDPGVFPDSAVAFVNCAMDAHILTAGWQLNHATAATSVRFQETQSTDLSGAPLDLSGRTPFSTQINAEAAAALRDLPKLLDGWTPAWSGNHGKPGDAR